MSAVEELPAYLSKMNRDDMIKVISSLSPKEMSSLSANKEMREIIQKNSEEIYDLKIKKDFPGINYRVIRDLLEFIKMMYPFIITLFILNEKKMAELNFKTIEQDVYPLSDKQYDSVIQHFTPSTQAFVWGHPLLYFYKFRFLNIKYHTDAFNKKYEEELANAKKLDTVKYTMQSNLAWVMMPLDVANQKFAADINFASKMRKEWEHIYTQMVAKLTELHGKRLARMAEIEGEIEAAKQKKAAAAKLKRETRKETAAAQVAAEEAEPSTSGRVTRSRTRSNQ